MLTTATEVVILNLDLPKDAIIAIVTIREQAIFSIERKPFIATSAVNHLPIAIK